MVEPLTPEDPPQISGYRLSGRLGAGGMGAVYLSSTPGGHPVALKVIRREFAEDPEYRRRFTREVAAARRVQGPYTAAVLDSDTEGDRLWLASSYVPGPSLADAVHLHGPLPMTAVLSLTAGIAEALQAIHAAGITHRDLKPTNVLLASDGPRVIDFGIARATDATALTSTDTRLGTPAYMSPEQADGRPAGPAVDVFALGLVICHASTGRHPFGTGEAPALLYRIVTHAPDLTGCPEPLRPLIERCLAKEPGQRPDPGAVVAECRRIAESWGADLGRGEGWWRHPPPAGAPHAPEQRPAPWDAHPRTAADGNPAGAAPLSVLPTHPAGPPPGRPPLPPAAPQGRRGTGGARARRAAFAAGAVALVAVVALIAANLQNDKATTAGDQATPSASGGAAANIGNGATVRIGGFAWDESTAVTTLWEAVLERRGYRVRNDTYDTAQAFAGLARDQIDLVPDVWLPSTHAQYFAEYRDDYVDLGTWCESSLEIAVPSYVKDVKSLADLQGRADEFAGEIVGIEPSAGETQLVENKVLPGYGLDKEYQLATGSTAAMLAQLDRAYAAHQPIAVALWEPHWAHSRYDLTALADPKGVWGDFDSLHTLANKSFPQAQPRVAAWLRDFHLTLPQLDSLEQAITDADPEQPMEGVKRWIARNPGVVDAMAPVT